VSQTARFRKSRSTTAFSTIAGRLPDPPILQTLTFWLVEIGEGFAAFEANPGDHLLNPMGTAHGGWAMTLIDSATGCAGYSLLPAGAGFRTLETKVHLSRPITSDTGRVRAEAHVVSQTRQIISTEARATARHVDPDGRLRRKMTRQPLYIKRVYQQPDSEDGVRVLVDRLWPRGLSREKGQIDLWLKEIAPSDALRHRFHAW
jgi:uncharacterized protein (TIGR00369 family)